MGEALFVWKNLKRVGLCSNFSSIARSLNRFFTVHLFIFMRVENPATVNLEFFLNA